jgi:DNA topoisomerase-1
MNVVIVESPAKAKTINKYLGQDYEVLASYGHVRDLPAKDGSVRPGEDFAMSWEVDGRGEQRLKSIIEALKRSDRLYLATDPDREGEAISWHIVEELKRRKILTDQEIKRVVFNEITRNAVLDAFSHPRDLNSELVEAYLARRALDYLVGFTLSPVLWRKLPGSRSAGRVQSVALRLICDREAEVEAFRSQEYWTIEVGLANADGAPFRATLTHLDGHKLEKFALGNTAAAEQAADRLRTAADFTVAEVERKRTKRNPYPPFTTSTLQQEASRKLGFAASRTMRLAQKLYEGVDLGGETVGLITYMRTDGVQISGEAIAAMRETIAAGYGDGYLPASPRIYRSKSKNAQEAHEAIRPTDPARRPQDVARALSPEEKRLYELIWKRAVASQMASAEIDQVSARIAVDGTTAELRATGSSVAFDGFLKLYQEGHDDANNGTADQNGKDRRLPALSDGERAERRAVEPQQHFTQPPPRYTEASLVKKMEELGIGRPSTYASILQVLQDRDYVRLEQRRFLPEDRGRLVTAFLASFFERYVEYNFTADLEEQLDNIAAGRVDWKKVLDQFWRAFSARIDETKGLSIASVIDAIDEELGPHFFPEDPEKPDGNPRQCPSCTDGRLGIRFGRNGGFIGCSTYPECRYTRPLATPQEGDGAEAGLTEPKVLGQAPDSGEEVSLRKGPYGLYVQLGQAENGNKPKRTSLPKGWAPEEVDLTRALGLLSLPREVGPHPESGEPITAGIGRYGPYVKLGRTYKSLEPDDDVLNIGLNRAVTLLAEAPKRRGGGGRELGLHPDDDKPVTQGKGRYGPYVKHGRLFATIPGDKDPEQITLDEAVTLLAAQAEKKKKKKKTGGTRKAGKA